MFPTITLGPLTLGTYTTVYSLALLLAGMIAFYRLRRGNRPAKLIRHNLPRIILAGFAGTYLISIIPMVIDWALTGVFTWHLRGVYIGSLLGVSLAVWVLVPRNTPGELGRVADLGTLPWPLFQAIGRIGCLGAGCCYGRPTDSWAGMYLRNAHGEWATRYPTQLISGIDYLLIFMILIVVEQYGLRRARKEGLTNQRIWPFDGLLYLLYFNLYCVDRFAMECLRGDAVPLVGPFSWVHFAAFAAWLALTGLIIWNWRRATRNQAV